MAERPDNIERAAILSADGRYRYLLTRRWSDAPTMAWLIGLVRGGAWGEA